MQKWCLTFNIFNFYKTSQKRKALLKNVSGIKKTEGIFLRKKWELFEDERLQKMVRKKRTGSYPSENDRS